MNTLFFQELKQTLSEIAQEKKHLLPIALFPHRQGTNVAIIEYIENLPGCQKIAKTKNGFMAQEETESLFYFFNFNRSIPTGKESFYKILDSVIAVAKDKQLVVVFDDWEGNRHEEMRTDIERALNWIKEYHKMFEIYNCDTRLYSNGKPID